jgi:hypothetical protein
MTGAICGGSPYLWKVEEDPKERWCFGERKRLPGRWELRAGWEAGTVPDESVGYWEPIWTYHCSGCGKENEPDSAAIFRR